MHKALMLIMGFTLSLGMLTTISPQGQWSLSVPVAQAQGIESVQLILKKLRGSMASMKDLDALEEAGMSKDDVNRMRRAMKQKIKQMTNDAVDLIRDL